MVPDQDCAIQKLRRQGIRNTSKFRQINKDILILRAP